jgi:hypothetical protein
MSKRTSYGKNYHPDVHFIQTSARIRIYPGDGFLPSVDVVKTTSAQTWGVRTDGLASPRGSAPARTWRRPVSIRTRLDTRREATGPRGHGFRGGAD